MTRKSKREIERAVEALAPADAVRRPSSDLNERHREAIRAAFEYRYLSDGDLVGDPEGDEMERRAFLADAADHVDPDHAVVIRDEILADEFRGREVAE